MPKFQVQKSIQIDAPADKVKPCIEDFQEWPHWSPWLCMEPDASLKYRGTPGQIGHGYDWEGELVGAGGMEIANISGGTYDMNLHFLKPFKSKAKVQLVVESVDDQHSKVTWTMDGGLPFFLFFMVKMMKAMIGMDYERGLKMMKEYVETGKVNAKTEIVGVVDIPASHYVGVTAECTMAEIGDSMKESMPAAHKLATDNGCEMAGPPGCFYHDVNFVKSICKYTAAVFVKSATTLPGATTGSVKPCKALKVVHKGSYQHLGNSWSAAMSYQRYKKLKPLKNETCFEIYVSDPCETAEEDLVTEIYVPIRG